MLSGPIVAMVWEGRDAVKTGRSMLFLLTYRMGHRKTLTNSQLFWVQPTPSSRHQALFVAITLSYVSPSLFC